MICGQNLIRKTLNFQKYEKIYKKLENQLKRRVLVVNHGLLMFGSEVGSSLLRKSRRRNSWKGKFPHPMLLF